MQTACHLKNKKLKKFDFLLAHGDTYFKAAPRYPE
tara:strand:+ start:521 stop:625 length:105 start_codon:yes stop_codon:yes gene_type:complete